MEDQITLSRAELAEFAFGLLILAGALEQRGWPLTAVTLEGKGKDILRAVTESIDTTDRLLGESALISRELVAKYYVPWALERVRGEGG